MTYLGLDSSIVVPVPTGPAISGKYPLIECISPFHHINLRHPPVKRWAGQSWVGGEGGGCPDKVFLSSSKQSRASQELDGRHTFIHLYNNTLFWESIAVYISHTIIMFSLNSISVC